MIFLNISQLRNNLQKIVSKLQEDNDAVVITVNGVPKAVFMTVDEYNKLKGDDIITTNI